MSKQNETHFINNVLPCIENEYDVELRQNGSYTFRHEDYGIIDVYPKSNRMLIRKDNRWLSRAFDKILQIV